VIRLGKSGVTQLAFLTLSTTTEKIWVPPMRSVNDFIGSTATANSFDKTGAKSRICADPE